jgi:hypothetical protein
VTISGVLPDLRTQVPAGMGELGRITLSWMDNSQDETGFRIFQECNGVVSPLLDVPANQTSQGPLQTCRPGRIGVASLNAAGVSAITYAP